MPYSKKYRPKRYGLSAYAIAAAARSMMRRPGSYKRKAPAMQKRMVKKPRRGPSRTTTKTKKNVTVASGNQLITRTGAYIYKKPSKSSKLLKLLSNLDSERAMTSGLMRNTTTGFQAVEYLGTARATSSFLQTIYERSLQTNATTAALGDITTGNARKYWLDFLSWTNEYTLVNQMPGMAKVEFYDVICKRRNANDPIVTWLVGLQQSGGIDPVQETTAQIGSKPTDSAFFNDNWKVLKHSTVFLQTGATHIHKFTHHANKKMNVATINEDNLQGIQNLPGITTFTIMVLNGLPIDDNPALTTGTNVTTDLCKIIWTNQQTIKTRVYQLKAQHIEYSTVLPPIVNGYGQNVDSAGIHDVVTGLVDLTSAIA